MSATAPHRRQTQPTPPVRDEAAPRRGPPSGCARRRLAPARGADESEPVVRGGLEEDHERDRPAPSSDPAYTARAGRGGPAPRLAAPTRASGVGRRPPRFRARALLP